MAGEAAKLAALGLKSHPFRPYVPDPTALAQRGIDPFLNPTADVRALRYYYDLYDWSKAAWLGKLSPATGVEQFPPPSTIQQGKPPVVVVVGQERTGRDSLVQVLLYRLKVENGGTDPLTIVVSQPDDRHIETLKRLAVALYDEIDVAGDTDLSKRLESIYKDAIAEQAETESTGAIERLFERFERRLRNFPRKIVVRVDGGTYDAWKRVYTATAPIAHCLVVTTPQMVYASTYQSKLAAENARVGLVHARRLDQSAAVKFATDRIAVSSINPPSNGGDALGPYTRDAILSLYEPGAEAVGTADDIAYSIGWLSDRLRVAMDNLLDGFNPGGPGPAPRIGPEAMTVARDHLNGARHA